MFVVCIFGYILWCFLLDKTTPSEIKKWNFMGHSLTSGCIKENTIWCFKVVKCNYYYYTCIWQVIITLILDKGSQNAETRAYQFLYQNNCIPCTINISSYANISSWHNNGHFMHLSQEKNFYSTICQTCKEQLLSHSGSCSAAYKQRVDPLVCLCWTAVAEVNYKYLASKIAHDLQRSTGRSQDKLCT